MSIANCDMEGKEKSKYALLNYDTYGGAVRRARRPLLRRKRRPHKDDQDSRIRRRRRQDIFRLSAVHRPRQNQPDGEHEQRRREQRRQQRPMQRHDQHRRHDYDAAEKRHLDPVQQCFELALLGESSVLAAAFADVVGNVEAGLALQVVVFDEVGVH